MADANSAYTLADAAHLKQLDAFNLMMMEQPLAHDDIIDHAILQSQLHTPICLDECIRTPHHAEQAIALRACRVLNIKLGRVGGYHAAKQIHDFAHAHRIPVWCGGMLESGIGRAHNIALSTLPGFHAPRRRLRQQALLDPRHHRAARRSLARRHHHRSHGTRVRL